MQPRVIAAAAAAIGLALAAPAGAIVLTGTGTLTGIGIYRSGTSFSTCTLKFERTSATAPTVGACPP